jgi:tetrahydromethanopterin S-methyltransferase subunit B
MKEKNDKKQKKQEFQRTVLLRLDKIEIKIAKLEEDIDDLKRGITKPEQAE